MLLWKQYSIILLFLKQYLCCSSYAFPFTVHGKSQITDIAQAQVNKHLRFNIFVHHEFVLQIFPQAL